MDGSVSKSWRLADRVKGLRSLARELKEVLAAYLEDPVPYSNKTFIHELREFTEIDGQSIAIIGVGDGELARILLAKGARRVAGVEPFPRKSANYELGPKFELVKSFGENTPLADCAFDIAYSAATLEHVSDPGRVLDEMIRILKPGGLLYCNSEPLWHSAYGYHAKQRYPKLWDPWFHLLYDEQEYIVRHPELSEDPKYSKRLHQIHHSPGYNRLPAAPYYEAVLRLARQHFLHRVAFVGHTNVQELFPDDERGRKLLKKFEPVDLFTRQVVLILRKRDVDTSATPEK